MLSVEFLYWFVPSIIEAIQKLTIEDIYSKSEFNCQNLNINFMPPLTNESNTPSYSSSNAHQRQTYLATVLRNL